MIQILTKRERETLEWVAKKKKNREIAQLMGITEYTVNKYMSSIMSKFGVHTRMDAVKMEYIKLLEATDSPPRS